VVKQPTLFDEQAANLSRVRAQIAPAIVEFCRQLWESGTRQFHMEDLRRFVVDRQGHLAPASCDRILRQLRREQRILYEVVNRRQSLYRLIQVAGE
jgi:hypothetical protein